MTSHWTCQVTASSIRLAAVLQWGTLINAPTRAVKGHDWDGSESLTGHERNLAMARYISMTMTWTMPDWDTDFHHYDTFWCPLGYAYAVEVEALLMVEDADSITFLCAPNKLDYRITLMKVCLVFFDFYVPCVRQ